MFKQTTLLAIDGVWCDKYELGVYALTDNKDFFGVSRTAIQQDMGNFSVIQGFKDSSIPSFKLILVRVKDGKPIPMDNAFRYKVSKYLFKKKISEICFDNTDLIYYGYFSSGQRYDFGDNSGYLECELTFAAPYGMTRPIINEITNWDGESVNVELECLSNVDDYVSPFIEIEATDGNKEVSIKNHSLGIDMNFKNIPVNSIITIDSEMMIMECTSDYKFSNFNRQWMRLSCEMTNYIEVQGKCNVRFINQYAMMESSEQIDIPIINGHDYYNRRAICGRFLSGELNVGS